MAVTMATPPTVLQNTLPAATHNLEFEHCSTDSNSSLFEHFLAHHIVSTLLWFEKHYFAEKISKALTKYERLKMKRDACQKCSLFLTAFLRVSFFIFGRSYFVRALNFKLLHSLESLNTHFFVFGLFFICLSLKRGS